MDISMGGNLDLGGVDASAVAARAAQKRLSSQAFLTALVRTPVGSMELCTLVPVMCAVLVDDPLQVSLPRLLLVFVR